MQLIVISPDNTIDNETEIVNRLFANGLQKLHLRKPQFTAHDHSNYIARIDTRYHSRIILHSCFELLTEFQLGGVHLNSFLQKDIQTMEQVSILSPPSVSASFHTWDEIAENNVAYNYVFISPVFDSISKSGYKAGIDLAGCTKLRRELEQQKKYCPAIIGLGGVALHQLKTLYNYGFDGAAMLGAVWLADDPAGVVMQAQKILAAIEGD
jgi:thiamine-phosphate pyrophosphorylase